MVKEVNVAPMPYSTSCKQLQQSQIQTEGYSLDDNPYQAPLVPAGTLGSPSLPGMLGGPHCTPSGASAQALQEERGAWKPQDGTPGGEEATVVAEHSVHCLE